MIKSVTTDTNPKHAFEAGITYLRNYSSFKNAQMSAGHFKLLINLNGPQVRYTEYESSVAT